MWCCWKATLIAGTVDAIPAVHAARPSCQADRPGFRKRREATRWTCIGAWCARSSAKRSIAPDHADQVRAQDRGAARRGSITSPVSWVIEAYRAQAAAAHQPEDAAAAFGEGALRSSRASRRGMRNKEIAYQIGTTEQVIKNYLRKIYDKLGVSDRLELALVLPASPDTEGSKCPCGWRCSMWIRVCLCGQRCNRRPMGSGQVM